MLQVQGLSRFIGQMPRKEGNYEIKLLQYC